MGHVGAGNLVVGGALHPSSQNLDSLFGGFQFLAGLHGLHGEEVSARLYQRQTQLTQYAEVGYRTGNGKVKALPVLRREFLRPGVDALYVRQAQVIADLLQKGDPFAQGIQQRQLDGGFQNFHGHPRKSRPSAHIHHGLAL